MELSIIIPNIGGCVLGILYTVVFLRHYAQQREKTMRENPVLPGTVGDHIYGGELCAAFLTMCYFILSKEMALTVIGFIAVAINIVLFASPLAAAREIVAKKDASSIQIPFVTVMVGNTFCWTVYGIYGLETVRLCV